MLVRRLRLCASLVALFATCGCASSVSHWIVGTRDRQGDVAMARGAFQEAANSYRLALKIAPSDAHARSGFSTVEAMLAAEAFREAKYDEALKDLADAAKVDPQSVRVAQLRQDIEQARIKREIVLSNYPTYKETERQLRRSYESLKAVDQRIVGYLQRFDYTYDTQELSRAIVLSYDLSAEIARETNRLVAYRRVVESGSPEEKDAVTSAAPSSLLPLP